VRRTAVVLAAVAALSACSSSPPRPTASPSTSATSAATAAGTGRGYLALGDSVPFGYTPQGTRARPATFTGYPELAAKALGLKVTNASCPGETSGSLIDPAKPGWCRGWRVIAPLHVSYTGTQLAFATAYLRAHPATALVSITVGANDVLMCAASGADACAGSGRFAKVLDDYTANLRAIVTALRRVYAGPLIAVTYYSTDYRKAQELAAVSLLDARTKQVLESHGGSVADGLAAFRTASASAGGDPCAAHLLAASPNGGCDIHPSAAGTQLLAQTLERAYARSR
jgi:lysophospholipase L1-like esterase